MKAKANYSAVTGTAGGEYSYSANDHREARKDTLFNGAIVIGVIAVMAVIGWYLWKSLSGSATTITEAIQNPVKTVVDAGNKAISGATEWTFNKAAATAAEIPAAVHADTTLKAGDPLGDWYKLMSNPVLTAGNTIITPINSLTAMIQEGGPSMNGDQFSDKFRETGGIAGEIFHYGYDLASRAKAAQANTMNYWPW